MYNFIETSIRNGISMISSRYAKSNNTYNMCFKSDPEKPKSYISYLDATLPTGGFKFLSEDEKHSKFSAADMNIVLSSLADGGNIGYILEVYLDYPKALHVSHNH